MGTYKKGRYISTAAWIVGFFVIWELAALLLDKAAADPMAYRKLPYFHQVAMEFGRYISDLVTQGAVTMRFAGLGFILGCAAGILLALLMQAAEVLLIVAGVYKTLMGVLCIIVVVADMAFLIVGSAYLWKEGWRET